MKNHRIQIVEQLRAPADADSDFIYRNVCCLWAERTENGGRENLTASRIVGENEVVYTVRWRCGIQTSMFVRERGELRRIIGVQEEGFRDKIHIRVAKDNTGDADGY